MITHVDGNLLFAKEKYLLHQCNCFSKRSAHLAQSVFQAFPWADIYTGRQYPDNPGDIIVRGDGITQRFVINLLGQVYPGGPKYPNDSLDGTKARQKHFIAALLKVTEISNLESLAFPSKIGCGSAKGNWDWYLDTIQRFDTYINHIQPVNITIYKLEI